AVIADELCHWHTDGANPDAEVIRAAEPALSLTDGLLLGISTPHARSGVMYHRWKRHHGKEDAPALIVQAESRILNANLAQSVIDEAMAEDAPAARAEYLAQWRDDVAGYVTRPVVEALVDPGVTQRVHDPRHKYRGFVDVSGGSRDSFCWGIAHTENGIDVLDLLAEVKPPFDPSRVVAECADDMRRYRLAEVRGDAYG